MAADLFDHRTAAPPTGAPARDLDPAFAARPRLVRLREELTRAAKRLRPARWNEPPVFFFDPKRQAELEAIRPDQPNRFAELNSLIAAEVQTLLAAVEVRRVARAVDGLIAAARALAPYCTEARELADLLAVPDDEMFLVLAPATRTGVRLHLQGAADVVQLYRALSQTELNPSGGSEAGGSQLFLPAALRPDGTLPTGFTGCEHWLWPTQPLSAVPRIGGERVVLVGPAVVRTSPVANLRFPQLTVVAEMVEALNAFQTTEVLARLCGCVVPVQPRVEAPVVARAA